MHEMGHALSFNQNYPAFQTYKTQGYINDANVVAYQGATIPKEVYSVVNTLLLYQMADG